MNPTPKESVENKANAAERKERFTTLGGIPLKTFYTEDDLPLETAEDSIGIPGEFPYTRGILSLIHISEPTRPY